MGIAAVLGSVFQWLLTSKVGRFILLAEVAAIAFVGYTQYVSHKATAEANAKIIAVTAAESQRRLGVLDKVQAVADKQVTALAALQAENEKLRSEIKHKSAANRGKSCLDAAAVERLRHAGRRKAGSRTEEPESLTPEVTE